MKEIRHSDTQEIHRSGITLNPYNPKRHTDKQVKQQVANIRKNGYLGGIVWNKATGKLVDGHRRVQALDIIHKYKGTPETDYTLKVEVVDYDEKTELEQLTYMALGNSRADYNLVARYADQIDTSVVGLSDEDYKQLQSLVVSATDIAPMPDLNADFVAPPVYELDNEEKSFGQIEQQRREAVHASKDEMQAKKERNTQVIWERNAGSKHYILLDFNSVEDIQTFCELTGLLLQEDMIVDGMDFLDKLNL